MNTTIQNPDAALKATIEVNGVTVAVAVTGGMKRDALTAAYVAARETEAAAKAQKDALAQALLAECGDLEGFTSANGVSVTVVKPTTRTIDLLGTIGAILRYGINPIELIRSKIIKVDATVLDNIVKAGMLPEAVATALTTKKDAKPYVKVG